MMAGYLMPTKNQAPPDLRYFKLIEK